MTLSLSRYFEVYSMDSDIRIHANQNYFIGVHEYSASGSLSSQKPILGIGYYPARLLEKALLGHIAVTLWRGITWLSQCPTSYNRCIPRTSVWMTHQAHHDSPRGWMKSPIYELYKVINTGVSQNIHFKTFFFCARHVCLFRLSYNLNEDWPTLGLKKPTKNLQREIALTVTWM